MSFAAFGSRPAWDGSPTRTPGTCSSGWSRRAHGGPCRNDVVLLLEHPPVFTLGKRGGRESLLVPEETLARHGIPIVQVERGGNITYHGPASSWSTRSCTCRGCGIGVVDMVDRLEEVMIRTCARLRGRRPGATR